MSFPALWVAPVMTIAVHAAFLVFMICHNHLMENEINIPILLLLLTSPHSKKAY